MRRSRRIPIPIPIKEAVRRKGTPLDLLIIFFWGGVAILESTCLQQGRRPGETHNDYQTLVFPFREAHSGTPTET